MTSVCVRVCPTFLLHQVTEFYEILYKPFATEGHPTALFGFLKSVITVHGKHERVGFKSTLAPHTALFRSAQNVHMLLALVQFLSTEITQHVCEILGLVCSLTGLISKRT
jgi:hypothetical protein